MEEDFDFWTSSTAFGNNVETMDIDENPVLKVGEEKEIGKTRLKKKLLLKVKDRSIVRFDRTPSFDPKKNFDPDNLGCQYSSRSLSTYAVFLGDNMVSWKTKKQQTVSKSPAEAEHRSMLNAASELVWIHGLLEDLQVSVALPIKLYCDNASAEHLARNPMFHEKTKHVKRDMHYVKEQVEEGFLTTSHFTSY